MCQLCRKINEKPPSSVHVLNSKSLMLKNCMVVLGLATSHHDSEIAGTFAQQLGWVFVGPFHPSAHGPPAKLRSFTSLQMVLTHRYVHTCTQMNWTCTRSAIPQINIQNIQAHSFSLDLGNEAFLCLNYHKLLTAANRNKVPYWRVCG